MTRQLWKRGSLRSRDKHSVSALATCVFLLALALTHSGCVTGPGARTLSGTYVHLATGGVIVFQPDGEFRYAFTTATDRPGNVGLYRFAKASDTEPLLTVRAAHSGQFRLRVSESGDRVFLTHPQLFSTEQVYERRPAR